MMDKRNILKSNKLYDTLFVLLFIFFLLFIAIQSVSNGLDRFDETFFEKKFLIQNFNRLKLALGDRIFPNVLVGENGWMEYTGGVNLDDFQNSIPLSPAKLENLARSIEGCYKFAEDHDISFLIVVAPNKASIYPDKLPEQIRILSNVSRLDQLNTYLEENDISPILDLRPSLNNARENNDVYYEMGTHWNPYGAYIAYDTIVNVLSEDYPGLIPYPSDFFRFQPQVSSKKYLHDTNIATRLMQVRHLSSRPVLFPTRNIGNLVDTIEFPNETHGFHEISYGLDSNSNLPSALIFHDSFGEVWLNKFMKLNFSRAYFIHRQSSSIYLNPQTVAQLSPQIVIFQIVERNLEELQKDLSGCVSKSN